MSWVSHFIFDPIMAAIARGATSSSPAAQATAQAAGAAVSKIAQDVSTDQLSHNSVIGVKNAVVGDLETGLKSVVDTFVGTAVTTSVPLVGGLLAPEAVRIVNTAMDFAEQHALTYIAALFAHHRGVVAANVAPPAAVGLTQAA